MDNINHYIHILESIEQNSAEASISQQQLENTDKDILLEAIGRTLHILEIDILFDIYINAIRSKRSFTASINNEDSTDINIVLQQYLFLVHENKKLEASAESLKKLLIFSTTKPKLIENIIPLLSTLAPAEILNLLS